MDKLKYDFTFDHLKFIPNFNDNDNDNDNDSVWLWIFHVDKIPPHVGISQGGLFFSLKSNGKDELPVKNIIQIIENKGIKCVKLNLKYRFVNYDIRTVYAQFDTAYSLKKSCLAPIKEVLNVPDSILKLSELLLFLSDQNLLNGYSHFNVTKSELGILKYGTEDIEKRLNLLHA